MLVISIVPRLPPAIDGVGDYALNLAQQLRLDFDIETLFIVCDPNFIDISSIEGFLIERVIDPSAETLSSILKKYSEISASVLLHYVGYGYAKRGCPFWLIQGLEIWKTQFPQANLVTMFHELYFKPSFETILRSGFWLSSLQKQLANRLTQLSNYCLTSKASYAKQLTQWYRGETEEIPTLPVISNVGEPKTILPLAKRKRRLVIFGQFGSKRRVYQKSLEVIAQTCQILEIQEILDIGPSTNLDLDFIGKVPIKEIGEKASLEISGILSNSIAGFLNYGCTYLAKSGIFAAYAAHGMLIINHQGTTQVVDGLTGGKHYWVGSNPSNLVNQEQKFQTVANNSYRWYQQHRLSVHAKRFSKYLIQNNV